MSTIYESGLKPRGCKKTYDKCAVSKEDAQRIIGKWIDGDVTDACGWFDEDDNLKIMVADTSAGKRVTYRRTKSKTTIEYGLKP